jgi:hypothetical protein
VLAPPTIERAPAPEVSGDTRCPRPEDVAAALARMLAPGAPASPADRAALREDEGALVIVVRRPSGEIIGEKRLPATLSCAVRAEAAAVAIAALEARTAGGDDPPLQSRALRLQRGECLRGIRQRLRLHRPPAGALPTEPRADV